MRNVRLRIAALMTALVVPLATFAPASADTNAGPVAQEAAGPESATWIYNENSRKCLVVPNESHNWGVGLIQWTCHQQPLGQRWFLEASGLPRVYRIRNLETDQCIGLPNASTVWGKQVIQWPCGSLSGAPDHYWGLQGPYGPNRLYQLVNHNSRLCLAVRDGSHADGAAVVQWPCGAIDDHFWSSLAF